MTTCTHSKLAFLGQCFMTAVVMANLATNARADLGDELFKLTASDAAEGDIFGRSVAISGNTVIVGAEFDADAGTQSGSAYLFDATTGDELAKLTASDASEFDIFGKSVAISGNTAIVGARGSNGTGAAYLFDVTTGDELAKLTPSDGAVGDGFGTSVAISGGLKQWEVASGNEVRAFDAKPLHSYNDGQRVDFGGIRALAVSPDGKWLAAGGLHKASNPLGAVHEPIVLLFDWESQKLEKQQIAEGLTGGVVWRLQWLVDGSLMGVSGGSSGGFLLFWKPDADKDFHRFQLPNTARDMDLHPDGLQVATAHHDRHVRITRLAAKAS